MNENKTMTNEEYVACGGSKCPYCGSEDITGESFEAQGEECSQEISCNECGKSWVDIYKLSGFLAIDD